MIAPPPTPLFDDLSRKAVDFFWDHSHPVTGLTKDRATNASGPDDHTVASSASVGFALVANAVAVHRGWRPRAEARARTVRALRFAVDKYPHEHGFLFHFVDWSTGERMWKSEASTIDTTILLAGMRASARFWKDREIDALVARFTKRMDWEWMRTDGGRKPNEPRVTMGWSPENGFIPARWGDTFDECKMLYVLAYGATDMPATGWAGMNRKRETYAGIEFLTGGPLFLSQMSESFQDYRGLRDREGWSYEVAARNHARAQRAYTAANPGGYKSYSADHFGLSACDGPTAYNAYGAPGWTTDDGTITPTSAVATVIWDRKAALRFIEGMRRDHPGAWGRYGFPNGFNATKSWQSPDVIGIDLGMMMCAIENERDGFVWGLSNSDPLTRRGYQRIGFRKGSGDGLKQD